jgi:hypothetical protein
MYNNINMDGMGVNFMEFLDKMDTIAGVDTRTYKAQKYDFNDSDQEVAMEEGDLLDSDA